MTEDARFEDGADRPLRLIAQDAEDLGVVSALIQDAVFPRGEMAWRKNTSEFSVLLNRFRWEDVPQAERRGRQFERAQAMLHFSNVLRVQSQGDMGDTDMVLSVLALEWAADADPESPGGIITLRLAGDGAIRLHVDAIDVQLRDVTRPYLAPSGKQPDHQS